MSHSVDEARPSSNRIQKVGFIKREAVANQTQASGRMSEKRQPMIAPSLRGNQWSKDISTSSYRDQAMMHKTPPVGEWISRCVVMLCIQHRKSGKSEYERLKAVGKVEDGQKTPSKIVESLIANSEVIHQRHERL
jgi:hypothetical protein